MNENEKRSYLERYKAAKEKGVPFYPDIVYKDAVVSLFVFLILVALAFFIGAPLEERADPADTSYTPKPEWYFLFLFQLLKYFPGDLEVIGVVVLPTVAILLLFFMPMWDRSSKRHFSSRWPVVATTGVLIFGATFLTVQSIQEAPPPAEAAFGDQTAALYAENCAGCHGSEIGVDPATADLHAIIAQGSHDGMPAWTADLTTDEIDALAGFILSPAGSKLFTTHCSECHEAPELVAGDPLLLRNALEQGTNFDSHAELDIPDWSEDLNREERTALLNFLIAPDGRRLFAVDCSPCHGTAVAFSGEAAELREIISEGGLHLEMPPWQERLNSSELDQLAEFIVDSNSVAGGDALFEQYCTRCHGNRIPLMQDYDEARTIIATGGSHETMPVWGEVLTGEQIEALVNYTIEAAEGTPVVVGQQLYGENCASCHGDLGEGGENPARPGDIIAPISTAEYLKTRDNATLEAIIAQGQPNFGMSPFGSAFGGPLDDDQIDALVAFMRSWEADPPVELPLDVEFDTLALDGFEIYADICAQCHGVTGGGGVGPSLRAAEFRITNTDQDIFDTISQGHEATDMIAWGAILTSDQIQQLVEFIDQLPIDEPVPATRIPSEMDEDADSGTAQPTPEPEATEEPEEISFAANVMPILESRCADCHGSDGGWDAATHDSVINSGDNGPAVVPGDVEGSLLAQKLLGTHEEGDIMPPPPIRPLNDELIQIILDWIAAGAPDN
ncbi:MAG TPA: c-type cytochrome [Anaerolineae bacterium]|jgi:mono/diheme cytochrome c family protein|nr:c-type cytochrome [Anaerolineae bacterium]